MPTNSSRIASNRITAGSGRCRDCALDGSRFGQVLFGERLTIEILPGRHALRIHNTLVWKTAEFGAEPGEHVHFTVWNRGWGEAHYLLIAFVGWSPLGVGLARGTPDEVGPGG